MFRYSRLAACASALFLSVSLCFARPAAAQYTLTPLGSDFTPIILNNQGQTLGVVGNSLYLVTNGARQFVSNATVNYYEVNAVLNQRGQVAGVDNNGSLYLFSDGVKLILAPFGQGSLAGLNDNGEVVWNAINPVTQKNNVYVYLNGAIQNLGEHTATGVNNAGIISGGSELYLNGVWQKPPHLTGGGILNNNGQILLIGSYNYTYEGYPYYAVTYSIYSIATDSATLITGIGVGPEINSPGLVGFNDEGDFLGTAYSGGPSSANQSGPFGYIRGQSFNYAPTIPTTFPNVYYGYAIALGNRGQYLAGFSNGYGGGGTYYFDPDFTTQAPPGQYILGDPNANISIVLFNDVKEYIVDYNGADYLATPNAVNPAASVSGVVSLEKEAANAPAQPVTFEFRDATSNQTLFTRITSVGPDGAFTVSNVASGSYNVRVKSPKNLAQVVAVTKASGATNGISVFLPGGDANNDNSCDATDFGVLVEAYSSDSSVPGSGYDATADFNGDGVVDAADFEILVSNYNTVGAI